MRILWWIPLLWSLSARADDGAAVRKAIAAFNDPRQRASVLAPDADLDGLSRYRGPELSPVYFEVKAVRFVTPDVAVVDVAGSQYGTLVVKRSLAALFVLKNAAGVWRVAVLRLGGPDW
jgi:hypothetical protein